MDLEIQKQCEAGVELRAVGSLPVEPIPAVSVRNPVPWARYEAAIVGSKSDDALRLDYVELILPIGQLVRALRHLAWCLPHPCRLSPPRDFGNFSQYSQALNAGFRGVNSWNGRSKAAVRLDVRTSRQSALISMGFFKFCGRVYQNRKRMCETAKSREYRAIVCGRSGATYPAC